MVKDVCTLPGAGQKCPLPLFLPPHVEIEDDLLNVGPCQAKALPVVSLPHKLLVSVHAFVGLELLATTLLDKHRDTVLQNHIIHDFGSLCIFTMWLFNFFLVERTMRQDLQGKETRGKREQCEFDHHTLIHHQAVWHILLIPYLSFHLLLLFIILLLLLLILFILLLHQEVWEASRPSLLSCSDL